MDRRLLVGLVVVLSFCRPLTLPPAQRLKGVGAACKLDTECRRGMACTDNACAPNASLAAGEKCDLTEGCEAGLFCASDTSLCTPAGTGALNTACTTSADCARGTYCGLSGLFTVCLAAGTGDIGAACSTASECLAGLGCARGACAAGAPTAVIPEVVPLDCPGDSGAFRAYFEVPATNATPTDFFRLSFPNEARNKGASGTDLTGFPRPAAGPVGDMLAKYIEVASTETGGAGANMPLIMRMSGAIDEKTISYGANAANPTAFLFKVTPVDATKIGALDADHGCYTQDFENGDTTKPLWKLESVGGVVEWLVISTQTPFLCANTLAFRPRTDNPLEPNTLYAVALSTGVKSTDGTGLARDSDLEAMLANTPPAAGDRLARPYACYAPARATFASKTITSGVNTVDLAALTLFRTQDTQAPVKAVLEAVKTLATHAPTAQPVVTALTKCAPGVTSPCASADDATRGCSAADNPLYDEYHGKLVVPVLQAGTRPYLQDGGFIEYTDGTNTRRMAKAGDRAKVQGSEEVCFAITVPKSGFSAPNKAVVLYGHGTNGHFRSFTGEGQSDAQGRLIPGSDLASTLADGGSNPSLAVLSFDQPMHGPRRGTTTFKADQLYFNVSNPRSMRDNGLQAVADYAQFTALVKALSAGTAQASAGVSLGALQTSLANAKVIFMGHSQGGTNGALYVAATPNTDVGAALLSGTGGGLSQSLLNKSQPIDFRARINAALQDPQISHYHPVIGLMQMVGERSDPINFGRTFNGTQKQSLLLLPMPSVPATSTDPPNPVANSKSLLHVIGVGDTYTPMQTSSDLWRTFGTTPVFASSATVDGNDLRGAFLISDAARAPLKVITADTGSSEGLLCNCTPTAVPFQIMPPTPPVATPGACGPSSITDATQTRKLTSGSVVYRPDTARPYDGHFVLFEHADARRHAKTFLQTAAQSDAGFCSPVPIKIPQ